MSVIHTPRKPEFDLRLVCFPAIMFALLGVLFFRLWYFQVVKAPELEEQAAATRTETAEKPAPRGLVFDRNGQLLAGVHPQVMITAVYAVVSKHPGELPRLATLLGCPVKRLQGKLFNARVTPGLPVPIYLGASPQMGTQIAESTAEFPGIGVSMASMRYYPDTVSFSHILGYVRIPNAADIKRVQALGKQPAQFVGAGGIEEAYESSLMGQVGLEQTEIDSKRRPVRVVSRDAPEPGKQLVLTLDAGLQRMATHMLMDTGYAGGVVAIDPNNGEILCMATSPSYDQTLFQGGISRDDWNKLETNPKHPLLMRAMQASFSPGSTFKLVTSLAAYRAGTFDPNWTVDCEGGFHIGKRILRCLGHHGIISYKRALEVSCNTYFATLGYRTGAAYLRSAAEDVGLGQRTGIDIGGESAGVVPTNEWLDKHFKKPHWYGGDTANFAIGQGYIRATPLQMANLMALFANDGTSYKPHLVREIIDPLDRTDIQRIKPEVLHHVDAPSQFWDTVKDAMVGVIQIGTARTAQIPGLVWGGKTGSTEHGKGKKTHGWFIGFAPRDNPKIAIAVLVERGGHGGEIAAPIARAIVKRYLFPSLSAAAKNKGPAASISATRLLSPRR